MMRVAVIGAGVIGAAVARELALANARVCIYEQGAPASGTSSTSFAWVNSHSKHPRAYHELNVSGMNEHRALWQAPHPGPEWFFQTGNLEWAISDSEQARLADAVERLRALGYAATFIGPSSAHRLEPDVRLPSSVDRVAFFADEGYVLPGFLIARLLAQARASGARFSMSAVVGIEETKTGVCVRLEHGSTQQADAVCVCVGRWTSHLLTRCGYNAVLTNPEATAESLGYLAWSVPTKTSLHRVLTTPHLNVRPDTGRRLLLQAPDLDASASSGMHPSTTGPVADELTRRLGRLLAFEDEPKLEAVRVGERALPVDGLTVCGYLDEAQRVYVIATHSGITLGPLLGRLACQELVSGKEASLLADFRPRRLAGQAQT
jgi:glycine/D-amino acid oxidase-like deaminating enzyme